MTEKRLQGFLLWAGWQILAILLLLLLPGVLNDSPVYTLSKSHQLTVLALVVAYLVASLPAGIQVIAGRPLRLATAVVVTITALCAAFFLLLLWTPEFPVRIVIFTVLLIGALQLMWLITGRFRAYCVFAFAIVAVLLFAASDPVRTLEGLMGRQVNDTFIRSAFYNLKVTYHEGHVEHSRTKGGALATIGNRYLLATGDGRLFNFGWHGDPEELTFDKLPFRVPLNTAAFAVDAEKRVDKSKFRVADILVNESGAEATLFASHHFWKSDARCFVLRVSKLAMAVSTGKIEALQPEWETIYETKPCLSFKKKGHAFGGHQAGGRMSMLGDDALLLTVGDHTFDGSGSELLLPQDEAASYGKTIRIQLSDGGVEMFSTGHRNPQGLLVTDDGDIWSTEHGPQGGDELNRIVQNENYGWPYVTYGTGYGKMTWALSQNEGRHDGYTMPVYSWLPSIGVSNLISIEADEFPIWREDFFVASMKAKQLFRLRVRDGRVIYAEPFEIGRRIRDLVEGHDGRIILWTDDSALVSIRQAGDDNRGGLQFSACAGCHQINDGTDHGIGPDLAAVVGRKVASKAGFEYSDAMTRLADKNWSVDLLDKFLENPGAVVPGTTMTFGGIKDPEVRASIIRYLDGAD